MLAARFMTVVLAGCLAACAAAPMTPNEYRAAAKSGNAFLTTDTFDVQRPFAAVAQTFKKKAPECLSFRIGSTTRPVIGVGSSTHFYGRTKQTVLVSNKKAELRFQVKYENTVGQEPAGGHYYLIADAYPIGANRTRVQIYRRTKVELLATAIKGWASGEDLGCPDPGKVL
jgi:hypothetical protein